MTGKVRDDAEALAKKTLPSPALEPRSSTQSKMAEAKGDSLPPTSGARVVSAQPFSSAPGPIALSEPPPSSDAGTCPELVVGLVVAGKYRLERLLRKGGMGSVWVATHLGLDTPVAIKFMTATMLAPTEIGETAGDRATMRASRFEREARSAAQIRMANVVQVLDYGIDGLLPYIVMELLEGEDLGARLARERRLSLQAIVQILTPAARALQRAHDAGLVHRDLKPENIFLAREGDEMIPKILDFGVAKAMSGDRMQIRDSSPGAASAGPTLEGTVVGSPYYMSPEQALGRTDIDHRSDLWALGVIVFRALTGKRPFNSDVLLEAVLEICAAPIPSATSIAPDLPPEVDRFFERALAREPSERFQSVKELVGALVALEAAGPSGAPERSPRRSLLFGIGVAMIVAAVALFAAVSWTDDSGAPAPAPLVATAGPAPTIPSSTATIRGAPVSAPGTATGAAPPAPRSTATAPIAASADPRSEAPPPPRPTASTKATAPGATTTTKEVPGEKPPGYDLGY